MQALVSAVRCRRFFLILGLVTALGCAAQAQTDQIPANPPTEQAQDAQAPAVPAPAQAEPAAASPATVVPVSAAAPASGWGDLVLPMTKTVGGFGLVLCMILAAFMLFRKFAPQYLGKRTPERFLRVLETLSVGEKRNIVLVQAGPRKLLLASTAGQISLLTSLMDTAGPSLPNEADAAEGDSLAAAPLDFKNLYEMEKRAPAVRPAVRPALPPDIRGKMRELRKALEG